MRLPVLRISAISPDPSKSQRLGRPCGCRFPGARGAPGERPTSQRLGRRSAGAMPPLAIIIIAILRCRNGWAGGRQQL